MGNDPLNYADLQALAETLGRPLKTLVASHHDPFMAGLPAREHNARWFADLWQRFGRRGGHIRHIHYRMVSQPNPLSMPDGRPYENTEKCFFFLNEAARDARFLNLIPWRDLIDRRNDEPTIHFDGEEKDAAIDAEGGVDEYTAPSFQIPELNIAAPKIAQRYIIEIWIEKSTMEDISLPIARRHGINVVPHIGETSITRCVQLVDRAAAENRPVRILYISDFDPAGRSMPLACARKIEFIIRSERRANLDVQVRPIVLTPEQCREYRLPRTPIKPDEKRKDVFEQRFGTGATELDALEALHEGELARILQREIDRYYDDTLDDEIEDAVAEIESDLENINNEVHERHAAAIAEIEEEHEKVVAAVAAFEERARPLLQQIKADLEAEAPDVDSFRWPDPSHFTAAEDDDPLYDSTRDYVEQIDRYKEHQDKPTERLTHNLVCKHCGRNFVAKKINTKFCSIECKNAYGYETGTLKKRVNRGKHEKVCATPNCWRPKGKFRSVASHAKYCSNKCANAINNKKLKARTAGRLRGGGVKDTMMRRKPRRGRND
jgi:hypothetical protein